MTPATARALDALVRRFYSERAQAFAAKRRAPWPGFARLLARLPAGPVLDVGCGAGRFGAALRRAHPQASYLGVDASRALLAQARSRADLPAVTGWVALDVARHPEALPRRSRGAAPLGFAAVVALGLLHHVAAEARRAALLRAMAARVRPGGVLAVTLWRLLGSARRSRLEIPWPAAEETGAAVDPGDLEPGDALLAFDGDALVPRYAHLVDGAEVRRLVRATPLPRVDRYRADGSDGEANEYLLFERPAVRVEVPSTS